MTKKVNTKKLNKKALDEAFSEVYDNPPSTLKKGQSKSKHRKQMIAIALSKASRESH
jgi:hypothetical protein